ncbi:MAG: hypothetical protein FJZ01_06035 [Candidatus Sericytochromatia bacterium]|nr:hypothetical protein [Candidatus Tanganyikabacteria bacterium]
MARIAALAGMASERVGHLPPAPPLRPPLPGIAVARDRLAPAAPLRIVFSDGKTDTPLTADTASRLLAGLPHLRKAWDALQDPAYRAALDKGRRHARPVTVRLVDDRAAAGKVWPHAAGDAISIGEAYFSGLVGRLKGREAGIRNLLAHEYAHTQDDAAGVKDGYGRDGEHKTHEIIAPAAAMAEGWANYQGLRFDPLRRHLLVPLEASGLLRVKEDAGQAGKYRWHPLNSLDDDLANEMWVARTLARLEGEIPGGPGKLSRAFGATGDATTPRTFAALLSRLAADNPADAGRVMLVVDSASGFKASEARLREIFGAAPADAYLAGPRKWGRKVARVPVVGWLANLGVKAWLKVSD